MTTCLTILFFINLKTKTLIANANPVPNVPKKTSTIPNGLKILAIATPRVIGNQYFLLNTTNCESDSLIRNCTAPYEKGAIATVNTTYIAAINACIVKVLTVLFLI